jgi:outer membrane protein assembly factor BamB
MYHVALGDSPEVAWRADIGAGAGDRQRLLAEPLIAGGVVYTMDSRSIITAFDAASGDEVWRVDLEPEDEDDGYFGGGIAYADGRLYVTTGFARVFALDAGSGEVIWEHSIPAPVRAAPTVSDGRVFAITMANQLFALAAADGRVLWTHTGIEETAALLGAASPAVAGSMVVVPYSSGEIVALLAESGRVLWSDTLAAVNPMDPIADLAEIRGLPVIDRDLLVAISHSGRMVAIDLRSGNRVWELELGGIQMPWLGGDYVYVVTNEGLAVCITRRSGRIRWVRQLPRFEDIEEQDDPIRWTGPVLAGDRLIVAGSHGEALSLSPYTGELMGYVTLPEGAAVPPVVAEGTLYLLTEDAELIAMR